MLLLAGAVNGLILPVALAILLISVAIPKPRESLLAFFLYALGWMVVLMLAGLSGMILMRL